MKNFLRKSTLLAALMALIGPASATPFTATFDFTPTAGGQSLIVTNTDDALNTLDFFRIYLTADPTWGNYTNLAWVNDQAGAGWSSSAIDPIGGFGATPGEFDNYKAPGLADGASLGFSYAYNYAGSLDPTLQTFSYDAYFGVCFDDPLAPTGACAGLTEIYPGQDMGLFAKGMASGRLAYNPGQGPGPQPAPEPMTLSLLGIGLVGLAFSGRRRKV